MVRYYSLEQKNEAQDIVQQEADRCSMFYIVEMVMEHLLIFLQSRKVLKDLNYLKKKVQILREYDEKRNSNAK